MRLKEREAGWQLKERGERIRWEFLFDDVTFFMNLSEEERIEVEAWREKIGL